MKLLTIAMAAAMTMALAMNAASADRPGPDWLKPEQVIQKLTAKGYSNFSKIEADDGFWEVEAELDGVRYDIDVDPKTGEVVKSKRDN